MTATMLIALAEPNRLRIVELLRDQPRSVNDIAHKLRLRQPQASKHLRQLNLAGLVRVQPKAQQRIYSLQPQPFAELEDWLKTFDHRAWNRRLTKLDKQLKQRKKETL